MTHTNLTINELVCIDAYAENGMKGYKIAQKIKRSPQKVYDVLNAIKSGKSVKDGHQTLLLDEENVNSTCLPKPYIDDLRMMSD